MDTTIYWARVRKLQAELALRGDWLHIVTLENEELQLKGGAVSVCRPELAAKLIINGHHAVASDEQISEFKEEHERRKGLIGAQSRRLARVNKGPRERGGVVYEL